MKTLNFPRTWLRGMLSSPRSRYILNWIFVCASIALLAIVISSFLAKSRNDIRERAGLSLRKSLNEVHTTILETWVQRQEDLVKQLAANPVIIADAQRLVNYTTNLHVLRKLSLSSNAHTIATQTTRINGVQDMTIISPDFINIVSASERVTTVPSLVAKNYPGRLQKVFHGTTLVMPPIKVEHIVPDGKGSTIQYLPFIYFCTPVKDTTGRVIAVLTVRCDPRHDLDALSRTSNAGISGEAYVVDSLGRMMTESLFDINLETLGLISHGQKSGLNIEVRELIPGDSAKASQRPFTYAVAQVIQKKSGYITEPYYDYKGDRVLGAWLWDEELGLGFITEINESEALIPYEDTFEIAVGLGGIIALIAFAMLLAWKRITVDVNNENQQRLKVATESAGVYVWELIVLSNKSFKWGMDQGRDIFEASSFNDRVAEVVSRIHDEDKAHSLNAMYDYLSGESTSFYVEFRYMRPNDHHYTWISSYGSIVKRNADGSARRLLMVSQDINRRKQMEEVVRGDQQRLQLILDTSPVCFALIANGVVQACNPQFKNTFGLGTGDETSTMFVDLAERDRLRQLVQEQKLVNVEFQLCHTGGEPIDGLVTGHGRDFGEGPVTVIWIVNITVRKRQERQLGLLNDIVYGGLESASIGAWWIDTSEVNSFHALDKTVELLGLPVREDKTYRTDEWMHVIYSSSARFSTKRDIAAEVVERFQGVMTGLYSAVDISYPVFRPDGQMRWVNVRTYVPARHENGMAKIMVGVIIDVTTQKETEESMRREQERFTFSLEALGAHYWTTNMLTNKATYASSAMYTQYGYSEEEAQLIGKNLFQYIHPDDIPLIWELWSTFSQQKTEHYACEYRIRRKDGSWAWLLNRAKMLDWDEAGTPLTAGGITIEITDRKNTEIALFEAKEEAVQATKSKSEFLARMSHEIRTPMNAIIGITFLTLQTALTQKQQDNLKKVHESGVSLLGIINDILDFSKIEAGKLTLEEANFDLEKVFSDLANVVTYKGHEKGLEMIFDLQRSLPAMLIGDALRLKQVLINLVTNAIKFTSGGEIVVKAKKSKQEGDRIMIQFSVKDSGIGLSEEEINRLFQSFMQADNSTTRKYGGTGLGLSISKSLVEMFGGEIWIESVKGKGSTFLFTAWFELSRDHKPRDLQPPFDLRGMKVLVCDDNETASEVVKEMLEGFTFDVTIARSGEEAILELERNQLTPYSLVMMDWNMPGMDGIKAVKAIGENPRIESQPVSIMLTSYNRQDVLLAAEEAGVSASLIKPVSYSMLFDTIMSVFNTSMDKLPKQESTTLPAELLAGLQGKLVLLVEDNPVNQDVATGMLEEAGVAVEIAENGQEGVAMVKASGIPSRYEAVLMDLRMPVMDGYDATREIRKIKHYDGLPVIAMTADAISGIKEVCMELGMNDFINKPIEPAQFYNTLKKWIGKSSQELPLKAAITEIEVPEIPGVDKSARLARFGNNKTYLRFLNNFEKHFAGFVVKLKAEIDAGDMERAERMAHDLKGLSGMMDSHELYSFAVTFDDKFRQKKPFHAEEDILMLERLLSPIIATIKPAVEEFRKQNSS